MNLLVRVLLVAPLLTLAGCGADDSAPVARDAPSASSAPTLPSPAELHQYFQAVAAYDEAGLEAAESIAADGSPAQSYADYQGEFARAVAAGGDPLTGVDVKAVGDGFEACADFGAGQECATWADLAGVDGKLVDFTVNGQDVRDALDPLSGIAPVIHDGVTLQPDYAYQAATHDVLNVLVTLTAGDHEVDFQPMPTSADPAHGPAAGFYDVRGPRVVEAGHTVTVVLTFEGADHAPVDGHVSVLLAPPGGSAQSFDFNLPA